ncbi:unnamed protein product [Oikopleura dioica]|uniref:Rotatin N-terminal domain-containing protein n=1 Tax=Oikopleura dioica TaxID=34765 RepID=E4YL23_OIKDI|nr:unnamed protein product [Oikopleura dioica]
MSESGIRRNVDKLGHVLEEVRERALLHLNTKLVHGLVTLEDLNKCPGFSRRLLEWFNSPNPPQKVLVLDLIKRSLKIQPKLYSELGLSEFLSSMMPDLTPDEQIIAKDVLSDFHEITINSTKTSACTTLDDTANMPRSAYFLGENRPKNQEKYPSWMKVKLLPWQTLTLTDRQVLQQTYSSLCSRDNGTVAEYAHFYAEVILKDFQAEIFVQRPGILQALIAFVSTIPEAPHLTTSLETIESFTKKLDLRITQTCDASWVTTHQPGYPLGYENGTGVDQWERDELQDLMKGQTAVPIILVEMLDCLSGILAGLQLGSMLLCSRVMSCVARIFRKCVSLSDFNDATTQDGISRYLIIKLRNVLEIISLQVEKYSAQTMVKQTTEEPVQLYNANASLLSEMLKNLCNSSTVTHISSLALERALRILAFDHISQFNFSKDSYLWKILQTIDPATISTSEILTARCSSLKSASKFANSFSKLKSSDAIELGLVGCESTSVHLSAKFIEACIVAASIYKDCDRLVLMLLKNSNTTVRERTVEGMKIFIEKVCDDVAASGNTYKSKPLVYLLSPPVLEELIRYSLDDQSVSVSKTTAAILVRLLTTNMLWDDELKQLLKSTTEKFSHFLEIFADDESLGTTLREFYLSDDRLRINRIKSALRMMLCKRRDHRRQVMSVISEELQEICGHPMDALIDYFTILNPIELNDQRQMENIFRVDTVERLSRILKSESTDIALRYSSFAQLAIITVEPDLVEIYLQECGYVLLLEEIKKLADQGALTPQEKDTAGSLCDILRHICVVKHVIAKELSLMLPALCDLVKLVEHTSLSPKNHAKVLAALNILLFLEVLEFNDRGHARCPGIINRRILLPFAVEFIPETAKLSNVSIGEEEKLKHPSAQRSLRLAWNSTAPTGDYADILKKQDCDKNSWRHFDLETVASHMETDLKAAEDHKSYTRAVQSAFHNHQIFPEELGRPKDVIIRIHSSSQNSMQNFMGREVIQQSLCSLMICTHLLMEPGGKQSLIVLEEGTGLGWLVKLLKFRSDKTRLSILSILSHAFHSSKTARHFFKEINDEILKTIVEIVLDFDETPLVRSTALETLTIIVESHRRLSSTKAVDGISIKVLLEVLLKFDFFVQISHAMENYVYCDLPAQDKMAPITPAFVGAFNAFVISLLKVFPTQISSGLRNSGILSILSKLFNVQLIKSSVGEHRKSLLQQINSTCLIFTFVLSGCEEVASHFSFVQQIFSIPFQENTAKEILICYESAAKFFCKNWSSLDEDAEIKTLRSLATTISSFLKAMTEAWSYFNPCYTQFEWMLHYYCLIVAKSKSHLIGTTKQALIDSKGVFLQKISHEFEVQGTKIRSEANISKEALLSSAICATIGLGDGRELLVKSGFIERLVDSLEMLQIKLCTERPKKLHESCIGLSLISMFNICRNFSSNGKVGNHLLLTNFIDVLTRLWPLIVVNEKLIRVMLQMLLSFTKNSVACATAISSSNLISSIVKQFQYYEKQIRNRVKASPIFTLNFNLLCNLSSSQEARAFFWKANVLHEFTAAAEAGVHSSASKQQIMILSLWLRWLFCLSFHKDGRENILQTKDILDYLTNAVTKVDERLALLVIHNLCYATQSKTRISTFDQLTKCFRQYLAIDSQKELQLLVANSCWALMSTSQKAKGRLKVAGLIERLETLTTIYAEEEESSKDSIFHIHAALELLHS